MLFKLLSYSKAASAIELTKRWKVRGQLKMAYKAIQGMEVKWGWGDGVKKG